MEWTLINVGTTCCIKITFWNIFHLWKTSLETPNDRIYFENEANLVVIVDFNQKALTVLEIFALEYLFGQSSQTWRINLNIVKFLNFFGRLALYKFHILTCMKQLFMLIGMILISFPQIYYSILSLKLLVILIHQWYLKGFFSSFAHFPHQYILLTREGRRLRIQARAQTGHWLYGWENLPWYNTI